MDWNPYFQKTKDRAPHERLIRAASYAHGNAALDLGAGALVDTKYLLAAGFQVTAIDSTLFEDILDPAYTFFHGTFEEFVYPRETYDLVNAHYALPRNPASSFFSVFQRITESIKPGGIFVGQFFGLGDSWNTPESLMTFHTRAEVEHLMAPFDCIEFTEEINMRPDVMDTLKRWHVFHVLARKR